MAGISQIEKLPLLPIVGPRYTLRKRFWASLELIILPKFYHSRRREERECHQSLPFAIARDLGWMWLLRGKMHQLGSSSGYKINYSAALMSVKKSSHQELLGHEPTRRIFLKKNVMCNVIWGYEGYLYDSYLSKQRSNLRTKGSKLVPSIKYAFLK